MKTIAEIIHTNKFPLRIADSKGNPVYYEHKDGYWVYRAYDSKGNQIHWENTFGISNDNR